MDDKQKQHLESQLSAYLDNELSERERQEVEAFLAEYAEARTLLAELRATIAMVQKLPRAKASDQLMEDLRGRLERDALLGHEPVSEPAARGSGSGRRWIAAAAVIVLALVTGYMMGPFSRTATPKHDLFASREHKPAAPAKDNFDVIWTDQQVKKEVQSELPIAKQKAEETSDASAEMAQRQIPLAMEAASNKTSVNAPVAPAAAAPAGNLKNESTPASVPSVETESKNIELLFADDVTWEKTLRQTQAITREHHGSFKIVGGNIAGFGDKPGDGTEVTMEVELTFSDVSKMDQAFSQITAQVHSNPTVSASQPLQLASKPSGDLLTAASAPSLLSQANQAVAVVPTTKPAQASQTKAGYVLRVRAKTTAMTSRPAETTPVSGPSN